MINTEIKSEWVAALRSPDARQGTHYLERANGAQCCLGVLCRIAEKHGLIKNVVLEGADSSIVYFEGGGSSLPPSIAKWAFDNPFLNNGPTVEIDGCRKSLAAHNDSGKTFAQIADAIEAQL